MSETNTKEIFATRLLELRKKKRISRQKAADDLGISRSTLEYYEKCKRVPDIETLNNIAHYYMVSADYLLGNTEHKDPKIVFTNDLGAVYVYTGMQEDAFEKLMELRKEVFFDSRIIKGSFKTFDCAQYDIVEALNTLILNDNGLDLLALIYEFIGADKPESMPFIIEIIELLKRLRDDEQGAD